MKDGFPVALAVIRKVGGSAGVLYGGVVLRYGLLLREVERSEERRVGKECVP